MCGESKLLDTWHHTLVRYDLWLAHSMLLALPLSKFVIFTYKSENNKIHPSFCVISV